MNPQEFKLLLSCARSRPDAGSVRDLVSKGIDWQILLKLAAQHCVRPMLLQTLKSVCWDAVPQKIQLELTLFNKANVQRNLLFTAELLRLLDLFQQNTIPIAAFKGPVLAHSVYGHLSHREFSDLDVIVREADLSKAEDLLTACGYQADFADRDYRSAFLRYQGQYAFRDSNTGISIDLHWRLFSKGVAFPLQLAEIWPQTRKSNNCWSNSSDPGTRRPRAISGGSWDEGRMEKPNLGLRFRRVLAQISGHRLGGGLRSGAAVPFVTATIAGDFSCLGPFGR